MTHIGIGEGMKDNLTTVPGLRHVVAQALIEYHILKTCPKKLMVQVYRELPIHHNGYEYRADVLARYFHTTKGKREVIYEVQGRLNAKDFVAKMRELGTEGEIIELDRMPDSIEEASKFIEGRIVQPYYGKKVLD